MSDEANPAAPSAPAPVTQEEATSSGGGQGVQTLSNEQVSTALEGFKSIGLDPGAGISEPAKSTFASAKPAEAPKPKPAEGDDDEPIVTSRGEALTPEQSSSRKEKLEKIEDEGVRDWLRKMPNKVFDKYYQNALRLQASDYLAKDEHERLVAEREAAVRKELEEQLTSTRYFDHEEGYTLTPEYRELQATVGQLEQERAFWTEQLAAVRAGQPFRWLEQDKDGNVVVSQGQYDPAKSPTAEGEILSKITQAASMGMDYRRRLGEAPVAHKKSYEAFTGKVSSMDKQLFGEVTSPVFKREAAARLADFPKALQGRPEIKLLANLLAAGELLLKENAALKAGAEKKSNVAKALTNGAPAPTSQSRDEAQQEAADLRSRVDMLHKMAARR